MFEGL